MPQKSRDRAHERHVAPHQLRRQYKRIVAVVLRPTTHHHQEDRLETALLRFEIDCCTVRTLEQHIVEPDIAFALPLGRRPAVLRLVPDRASDLIRALVNDLEAHVLERGHALGERDRPIVAPHLQSNAVACVG